MSGQKVEPRVIGMDSWEWSGPDGLAPGCYHVEIASVEGIGTVGLYFIPPGVQTTVFYMEEEDDGTAEEYYGPCHEFYYILVGEFTMYWGEDASRVREGTSNKLALKPGDLGYWAKGWKYSVKNTGKVPGTFFWGISSAPEGTKIRDFTGPNYGKLSEGDKI
ncbi:hypothetical protein ES703_72678 [subsurface metagenome]